MPVNTKAKPRPSPSSQQEQALVGKADEEEEEEEEVDDEEDPNAPPEIFDFGQDDQENEDRGVEHAIVDGGCSTAIYSGSEDCFTKYVRTNVSLGTAKAGATLRAIGRGDLEIVVEWTPYGG